MYFHVYYSQVLQLLHLSVTTVITIIIILVFAFFCLVTYTRICTRKSCLFTTTGICFTPPCCFCSELTQQWFLVQHFELFFLAPVFLRSSPIHSQQDRVVPKLEYKPFSKHNIDNLLADVGIIRIRVLVVAFHRKDFFE